MNVPPEVPPIPRKSRWRPFAIIASTALIGFLSFVGCSKEGEPVVVTQIRSLEHALSAYTTYYGKPPIIETNSVIQPSDAIAAILTAKTNDALLISHNPDREIFLEDSGGKLRDPWGNEYHFAVDLNGSKTFRVGGNQIKGSFAVWSSGPNGRDELGSGDDVCSWK